MKTLLKLAAVVLLALSVPMPAFSQMRDMPMRQQGGGPGPMMMGMGYMDMMGETMGMCLIQAEKVGLTDEQIVKMKPGHSEMQKKQARFKADLKIAEIELRDIMEVKDFDLEKASAAARKIGEIQVAHHLEMLQAMKAMRAIITDEQFKKMKKMMPVKTGAKKPAKTIKK